MPLKIIVSYDDTDNDRDALALGRLLAFSGAELSLAYVRHSVRAGRSRRSRRRSCSPAEPPRSARRTCPATSSSTPGPASASPSWPSARTPTSSSSAPSTAPPRARSSPASPPTNCCSAGRRRSPSPRPACTSHPSVSVNTVGVLDEGDAERHGDREQPRRRARRRASASHGAGPVDLLVVGSRPESPQGKVTLSAASDYAVEAATYPVLVTPRGVSAQLCGARQAPAVCLTTRMTAATSGSRPSILSLRLAPVDRLRRRGRRPRPPRPPPASRPRPRRRRAARRPAPPPSSRGSRSRTSARAFDHPWPKDEIRAAPSAVPRGSVSAALARFPLAVAELDRPARPPRARRPAPAAPRGRG